MRWAPLAATARRGLLLLVCLLLEAVRLTAAFLGPVPAGGSRTTSAGGGGGAVRTFLQQDGSVVRPRPPQVQTQPQQQRGAVGALSAHAGPSATGPGRLMRRGYTRRRPQCVGKAQQQPQEHAHATVAGAAAGSGTALRALLAPEYDIIHVAGDVVAGFVGGAVGVVGTMVALEVKMRQVNERSKCPYCSGSGQLTCARCYGQQTVSYRTADGQIEQHPCPSCMGAGTVTCINCKGDGLAIPVMLDKKVSRDPETRLEEYGMG